MKVGCFGSKPVCDWGIDPDEPANAAVLVHEPAGRGDLAVRDGRLHPGQFHAVRHGALLAVRVEQPAPVQRGERRGRKPIYHLQQFLVHNGHLPAARIGTQSQGQSPVNPPTTANTLLLDSKRHEHSAHTNRTRITNHDHNDPAPERSVDLR